MELKNRFQKDKQLEKLKAKNKFSQPLKETFEKNPAVYNESVSTV